MLKFGKCFEIECFSLASNHYPRGQVLTIGNIVKHHHVPVLSGTVCFCFEKEATCWETFF